MIPFVSQRSVAQRVSVTLLEARRGRILRAYRFNGLWDKKMIEYEGKARDLEEAMKERHAQAPRSAPRPFSHLPLCALPVPSSHMFAQTGHARIGSTHC